MLPAAHDQPDPAPGRDRYGHAVLARRAELGGLRERLGGSHRAELRSELALSRIAASDAATAAFAQLRREARAHVEHPGRAVRRRLPALLAPALDAALARLHDRWAAELAPALRRIAAARSLDIGLPDWPRLPAPRTAASAPPPPAGSRRVTVTAVTDGLVLWRLVLLPLAALPLFGLPVLGGPAFAPLALGVGVAVAGFAVRARRVGSERAALLHCVDEALRAARAAFEADLGRRLLELERSAGADLDAAAARLRAVVDAESRRLTADA